MSRQQEYMRKALEQVQDVHDSGDLNETQRKAFGSICHQVPALVLNNGLGLTVAYLEDKGSGTGSGALPFRKVRDCLAAIVGVNSQTLKQHVSTIGGQQYMMATFDVLDAWVFYKRFAVSILGVQAGDVDTSNEDAA